MKLGLLIHQDADFPELVERFQHAEASGFDFAFVSDHTADYRNLAGFWLDGWTVLTHIASQTATLRIGTLVSNPLLHHPAVLARQAVAVDRLSNGRLELGIGTGIANFDHLAVGEKYWSAKERVARFNEYVGIVDALMRADAPVAFSGEFFSTQSGAVGGTSAQRPRPPITIAGQSPSVLRIAAKYGDCWNTHGPFGHSLAEILDLTATQNERVSLLCRDAGRDPATLRRSLLLFGPLDVWETGDEATKVIELFAEAGIEEFVFTWPPDFRRHEIESLASELKR